MMCSSAGHDPIVCHCAPVIGGSGEWSGDARPRVHWGPDTCYESGAGDTGHQPGAGNLLQITPNICAESNTRYCYTQDIIGDISTSTNPWDFSDMTVFRDLGLAREGIDWYLTSGCASELHPIVLCDGWVVVTARVCEMSGYCPQYSNAPLVQSALTSPRPRSVSRDLRHTGGRPLTSADHINTCHPAHWAPLSPPSPWSQYLLTRYKSVSKFICIF